MKKRSWIAHALTIAMAAMICMICDIAFAANMLPPDPQLQHQAPPSAMYTAGSSMKSLGQVLPGGGAMVAAPVASPGFDIAKAALREPGIATITVAHPSALLMAVSGLKKSPVLADKGYCCKKSTSTQRSNNDGMLLASKTPAPTSNGRLLVADAYAHPAIYLASSAGGLDRTTIADSHPTSHFAIA